MLDPLEFGFLKDGLHLLALGHSIYIYKYSENPSRNTVKINGFA